MTGRGRGTAVTDEESWGEMEERTTKKTGKITVANFFPPFLPGKWISRSRDSLSFLFPSFSFSTMPFSQMMTEKNYMSMPAYTLQEEEEECLSICGFPPSFFLETVVVS